MVLPTCCFPRYWFPARISRLMMDFQRTLIQFLAKETFTKQPYLGAPAEPSWAIQVMAVNKRLINAPENLRILFMTKLLNGE